MTKIIVHLFLFKRKDSDQSALEEERRLQEGVDMVNSSDRYPVSVPFLTEAHKGTLVTCCSGDRKPVQ